MEMLMAGKVLIACRQAMCRGMLRATLTTAGLAVCDVSKDSDFLLKMLEGDYDVLLYDTEKSGEEGLKMVKIIRKIRPKASVIVLSDNPSKTFGGQILQEGVFYYAVKPVSYDTIKQAVLCGLKSAV